MNWVSLIFGLIPTITKLVKIAEEVFSDKPKSGADKAQFVHQAITTIIDGAETVTTGGAHDTTEKVKKVLPALIDTIADGVYNMGK